MNYNGDDKFSYRVLDGRGGISSAFITLTGKAVNDAPTSTGLSLSVSEDPSTVLTITEATLLGGTADVDGDTLDVDSASFDSAGFTLVGDDIKIDTSAYQSLRAQGKHIAKAILTVRDSSGASNDTVSHTVTITITGENDAPTVLTEVPDQSSSEDALWSFGVPPTTFSDVDTGDLLQLSATLKDGSPLPSWLSFASSTASQWSSTARFPWRHLYQAVGDGFERRFRER